MGNIQATKIWKEKNCVKSLPAPGRGTWPVPAPVASVGSLRAALKSQFSWQPPLFLCA